MLATLFLPPASDLTLESPTSTLTAFPAALNQHLPTAHCLLCQQPASRVHSRYTRTLHDLPTAGRPVQLRLRVRRFFCRSPQCPRRIFSERLPTLAPAFAHRTTRQADALRQRGLVVGGEPGARPGVQLGLLSSPDTLLRLVRQFAWQKPPPPQQLGVDDWVRPVPSKQALTCLGMRGRPTTKELPVV